jgi:uncharacterized protein
MVKLYIPNHNKLSDKKHLIFDSSENCFITDDGNIVDKTLFFSKVCDFDHPIFKSPLLTSKTNHHTLLYDSLEQLFDLLGRIYPTIIKSKTPSQCRFDISPSKKFELANENTLFALSIDSLKKAQEFTTVKILNAIVSQLTNTHFHYSEKIMVKECITTDTLPDWVNADDLYAHQNAASHFLKDNASPSFFELRFISHKIGFGLYARQAIKKNTALFPYTGVKLHETAQKSSYRFIDKDDFNLVLDAKNHGNLARFINHAPKKSSDKNEILANVYCNHHLINGIGIITFYAAKDISIGEQLLLEYEKTPFENKPFHFKTNGKLYDENGKHIKKTKKDKKIIRMLATHGLKKAQLQLLKKPLLTLTLSILLLIAINLFL